MSVASLIFLFDPKHVQPLKNGHNSQQPMIAAEESKHQILKDEEIFSKVMSSRLKPVGCIETEFALCSIIGSDSGSRGFRLERAGRAFNFKVPL